MVHQSFTSAIWLAIREQCGNDDNSREKLASAIIQIFEGDNAFRDLFENRSYEPFVGRKIHEQEDIRPFIREDLTSIEGGQPLVQEGSFVAFHRPKPGAAPDSDDFEVVYAQVKQIRQDHATQPLILLLEENGDPEAAQLLRVFVLDSPPIEEEQQRTFQSKVLEQLISSRETASDLNAAIAFSFMTLQIENDPDSMGDWSKTVECCICIDYFRDPVTLPGCGHTFCRPCLRRTINEGNTRCPQGCGAQLRGNDWRLPKNFAIADLLERLNLVGSQDDDNDEDEQLDDANIIHEPMQEEANRRAAIRIMQHAPAAIQAQLAGAQPRRRQQQWPRQPRFGQPQPQPQHRAQLQCNHSCPRCCH
eukprot:m.105106 g.105106  ORF g.105106 m.105106 type:complete len:362 (+) comp9131_c0_seq1:5850-6935(+)